MPHSVERPAFAHLALRPPTIMLSCWLHRAGTAHGTVWTTWNTSSSDPIFVISFRPQRHTLIGFQTSLDVTRNPGLRGAQSQHPTLVPEWSWRLGCHESKAGRRGLFRLSHLPPLTQKEIPVLSLARADTGTFGPGILDCINPFAVQSSFSHGKLEKASQFKSLQGSVLRGSVGNARYSPSTARQPRNSHALLIIDIVSRLPSNRARQLPAYSAYLAFPHDKETAPSCHLLGRILTDLTCLNPQRALLNGLSSQGCLLVHNNFPP
ncbi:uncharacterized protein CLUP02_16034 [Colletotrichum lupini]|uniref:Uncharacterized protein n=1 Tax=Colletotrichum lupini TaxID=145971 RepID=A0A9Q8WP39_9PEZI|nr:uncharacterized protein CLUP02_16034 [Colletotrichum lupini]UQC90504.1 hypothetical protein CLUP02_16034 [Colletotrichum lupini]